jgi:cytosine/adenosine deaminase-related metal-dependent hydrolase
MSAAAWSITARWIFPVDGPPLEHGILTIAGDRIVAIEPHGTRTAGRDLGNVAILPGLVNAHTHLDLSGARGKILPSSDITIWLRRVIAYRRSCLPQETRANIDVGLSESAQHGTTLLGDISAQGMSWDALAVGPLRATVFFELLGLSVNRAWEAFGAARRWMKNFPATETCRPGFSPHAPYSFRGEFLQGVSALGRVISIHLAESAFEAELLECHTGPFVRFLTELGAWDKTGVAFNHADVIGLTSSARNVLYIHANYLPPETAIPAHGTIVYCPRTHSAFGHPPHPFREFLARGIRVALGTDSLASNPDLDVLAEARFIHAKHPDVPGDVLLRMAALSGAEALGWADEAGSLTPGKSADFIVLPLPNEEKRDPHLLVLESAPPVRGVVFRGRLVHGVLA